MPLPARVSLEPEVLALAEELSAVRRDLHRHPELGFEEVRTSRLVAARLRALGLEVTEGVAKTGVVGLLRGARPGRTLLLRADMDGLPLQEATGAPYASTIPGRMHACGHDGHVAMLLGAARVLARRRERLGGAVKFVFQPAEEGPGGAKPMIEAGVMEGPRVEAAFGLHLSNDLPVGRLGIRSGPVLAAADRFELTIRGQGGHGALPHQTVDAIVVGAHVVTALQEVVSREVAPTHPAVVSVGTIQGGSNYNIIAAELRLTGTLRAFDPKVRDELPRRVERIVRGVTEAFRAGCEFAYLPGYPPTVNDEGMSRFAAEVASEVVGAEGVMAQEPIMGAEDMSYFLAAAPGCFVFLGSADPDRGLHRPHHSPLFDFDESALPLGVQLLVRTAERYCA